MKMPISYHKSNVSHPHLHHNSPYNTKTAKNPYFTPPKIGNTSPLIPELRNHSTKTKLMLDPIMISSAIRKMV
jgi:hypothetical protein